MIRCPNCGELNDPGSRFCFNCGANLAAFEPAPEAQSGPEPRPPEPVTAPSGPPPSRHAQPDQVPEGGYSPPADAPPPPPGPAIPPQYQPPPYAGSPYDQPGGWGGRPQPTGWAALDELDPAPPPRKRATWLMVLLGLVAGCLLVCVGTFIYALTPPGQDTFEELGTVVAEFATEAAPEPTRST